MVLWLVLASLALAGEDEGKKVIYKSTTEIDFEDLEIEGILQRPQSALVLERKQASFNPLIKLRVNFNEEIEDSVQEVR
jgi:hypothetical protein